MATIERIEVHDVHVSAKTRWLFLELGTTAGLSGLGEVTCAGFEDGIKQQVAALGASLRGLAAKDGASFVEPRMRRALHAPARIVLSGFEQACLDLRARELGVAADELLGGRLRGQLRAYANINRGTLDRTTLGWQARARAAVAAGHLALKMAPFDGVLADDLAAPATRARIRHGIDAVLAVRDAVGPEVAINVDCHERFTEAAALALLRALGPANLFWLESPIPEPAANQRAIRRLRSFANRRGVRLAGAEHAFALEGYRPFVEHESLDVVLPDVRMCGGAREAARIGHYVSQAGIELSLHNPAGPVLDAVSMAVAAASPSMIMLEQAFQESPLQDQVTEGIDMTPRGGLRPATDALGFGLQLRHAVIAANPPPAQATVDLHGHPGAGHNA